jgi:REP-associated tyrosine transposase
MNYDPKQHRRRSIRKEGFDYTSAGGYFVTMCTDNKRHLFGIVRDGRMHLNKLGETVLESWRWLARQYKYVRLDEYCVMPNHFHGIIVITEYTGGAQTAPTSPSDIMLARR